MYGIVTEGLFPPYQVGCNRRSTNGTQTRCATWFSIVVRRPTCRANGIPHVSKLCVELNYTGAEIGEMWDDLAICHIVFEWSMLNRVSRDSDGESVCDRHVHGVDSILKGRELSKSLIRWVRKVSTRVSSYLSDLKLTREYVRRRLLYIGFRQRHPSIAVTVTPIADLHPSPKVVMADFFRHKNQHYTVTGFAQFLVNTLNAC